VRIFQALKSREFRTEKCLLTLQLYAFLDGLFDKTFRIETAHRHMVHEWRIINYLKHRSHGLFETASRDLPPGETE
jgi:hypothetical protein